MKSTCYTFFSSPIGELLLARSDKGLRAIYLECEGARARPEPDWILDDEAFEDVRSQLSEYFQGKRKTFELELEPQGTDFQRAVWRALLDIPYGETRTYGEQAKAIGRPSAVRAVGAANGKNPLSIVVPCHRVIGANGKLTGFGGGLDVKAQLLELERGEIPSIGGQLELSLGGT